MAIGVDSLATNNDATAVGYAATATNKAVAFGRSSKANVGSVAVGDGASALFSQGAAVGAGTIVSGDFGVAVGDGAQAAESATGIGRSTSAGGTNSVALGYGATIGALAQHGIAIGRDATSTHSNAIVIGAGTTSSGTNQIRLGTSTTWIQSPGIFADNTHTNTTFKGTNVVSGRVDFTPRNNSSLANGNNSGVVLGTNVFVRLSGATTIAYIGGFAAEQDGSFHILRISGSVTNTFGNESGVDATPANRIITGTGGDLSYTNNPLVIGIIYDATTARWNLIGDPR